MNGELFLNSIWFVTMTACTARLVPWKLQSNWIMLCLFFFYFCYFQDTCNASDLRFLSHESWILLLSYARIKEGLQMGASNSGSMLFVPLQKEFSTSIISCRIYLSHTVIYREKESTLFVIAHMATHSCIARGTYTFKMIKIYTHI